MKMKALKSMRGDLPLTVAVDEDGKPAKPRRLKPMLDRRSVQEGSMYLDFAGGAEVDVSNYDEDVVQYLVDRGVLAVPDTQEEAEDNESADDINHGQIQGATEIRSGLAQGEESNASASTVAGAPPGQDFTDL